MRYNPEQVCENILNQIRKYSEKEGLTMSSLSKEAGISASTLSDMMNKRSKPQFYTLLKICNALDVSMDVLIGQYIEVDDPSERPTRRLPMQRIYNSLPSWKRERVREYIEMIDEYER